MTGMDYSKMDALTSESGPLAQFKEEVKRYFDYVENELRPSIERKYGGSAADAYITRLRKQSENLQDVLNEMIAKFKEAAEQNRSDYQAQEAKLEDSVNL